MLSNLKESVHRSSDTPPHICPDTGKRIIELSHSGLNSFTSCPKRFAFRKFIINRFEERGETDATAVGSAMHEGLQEYMRSRSLEAALETLALHHPIQLNDNAKASEYSLEASAWTLMQAVVNSELPDYELVTFINDGVETPATEIAFLVKIEFEKYMFHLRGFIDLVLRNPLNGRFLPVDIKTTTPQGAGNMQEKYLYDWQVTSYGMPLNALLGNDRDFDVGIFGVIMSDREPKFIFPTWERKVSDIEDYQFYLLDKCRQIVFYAEQGMFPRHPQSCISFGRLCHYHQHCYARTVDDMQLVINPSKQHGYTGRPFNPVFTAHLIGD